MRKKHLQPKPERCTMNLQDREWALPHPRPCHVRAARNLQRITEYGLKARQHAYTLETTRNAKAASQIPDRDGIGKESRK